METIRKNLKVYNLFNSCDLTGIRVLLIYPPVRLAYKPLYPPFGLLSIASVMEKAGAIVEILDLNMERLTVPELRNDLSNRKFDIVGTGGMATVYYYIKFLAEFLNKEYPQIPIIGGGTVCSGSPHVVLEKTKLDAIVLGEGEPIIIDLVYALVNGGDLSQIPGIMYKDKDRGIVENESRVRMSNLDDIPFPAYHLIDMEKYILNASVYKNKKNYFITERIKSLNLDQAQANRPIMVFSKRGCPFGCNFCYRNFGQNVVDFSIQRTLDHMAFLEKKYNTINFVFGDENFNVSKKWAMEFCDTLIRERRNYILSVGNGLRANLVDKELLLKMKEAGFCSVAVGIESFHDPALSEMNKGQKAKVIANAIKDIKSVGFYLASAQFLFGYSSDGPESMKTNVKKCKELGLKNVSFAIPCPYPGTILYKKAIEEGYIVDEEGWLMELSDRDISDRVINMSGQSEKQLKQLISSAEDEIKMYFIRKEYPVLGSVFAMFQAAGRLIGISVFDTVKGIKDSIKNMIMFRKLPGNFFISGGTNDIHIRDEVLELLKKNDSTNKSIGP